MSDILENLKAAMQECQVRFQAAQQKMNVVNAEFQAVAQEYNAYQILIKAHSAKAQVGPMPPISVPVTEKSDGNKTEAVRDLLRRNPLGLTPGDIWKDLHSEITKRTYIYSILKRLKDREEVRERRGKYYLNAKPDGIAVQGVVQ